jgi:predicted O-methyltransferase YrrM
MTSTWPFWVALTGGLLGCAAGGEWLYRRRHPYVIGFRPFSPRRYAGYVWGRLRRFPAEAARVTVQTVGPYLPWVPLLLRKPRMARFFRQWNTLRTSDRSALEAGVPWLAIEAIEWLDGYLDAQMRAFEWGSGGSTLFLARRVRALVTVEHDATWHDAVSRQLESAGFENCRYLLREPVPETERRDASAVPGAYASSDEGFAGRSFREYCAAIDVYPDESFDLVVVDGRARPSCIWHARTKVRQGGVIIVDNSERPHYVPAFEVLEGWSRRDFAGPVAFHKRFSTTTIFVR